MRSSAKSQAKQQLVRLLMTRINAGCATLGTPIFGYIVDRTGSYQSHGRCWSILTFGITGLITLLKDPRD
jgi:hypothetical protein